MEERYLFEFVKGLSLIEKIFSTTWKHWGMAKNSRKWPHIAKNVYISYY